MFHEIKRPIKVFREQILTRLNVFSSSKKMISENLASVEKERSLPPVAKDVTKYEFKKRYKGLFAHSCIALFVFMYTLLFLIFSQNLLAFIVSSTISAFFITNYVISLYKAWVARIYYRDWENRFSKKNLNFRQFVDAIALRPSLLLPVLNINKEY